MGATVAGGSGVGEGSGVVTAVGAGVGSAVGAGVDWAEAFLPAGSGVSLPDGAGLGLSAISATSLSQPTGMSATRIIAARKNSARPVRDSQWASWGKLRRYREILCATVKHLLSLCAHTTARNPAGVTGSFDYLRIPRHSCRNGNLEPIWTPTPSLVATGIQTSFPHPTRLVSAGMFQLGRQPVHPARLSWHNRPGT